METVRSTEPAIIEAALEAADQTALSVDSESEGDMSFDEAELAAEAFETCSRQHRNKSLFARKRDPHRDEIRSLRRSRTSRPAARARSLQRGPAGATQRRRQQLRKITDRTRASLRAQHEADQGVFPEADPEKQEDTSSELQDSGETEAGGANPVPQSPLAPTSKTGSGRSRRRKSKTSLFRSIDREDEYGHEYDRIEDLAERWERGGLLATCTAQHHQKSPQSAARAKSSPRSRRPSKTTAPDSSRKSLKAMARRNSRLAEKAVSKARRAQSALYHCAVMDEDAVEDCTEMVAVVVEEEEAEKTAVDAEEAKDEKVSEAHVFDTAHDDKPRPVAARPCGVPKEYVEPTVVSLVSTAPPSRLDVAELLASFVNALCC